MTAPMQPRRVEDESPADRADAAGRRGVRNGLGMIALAAARCC